MYLILGLELPATTQIPKKKDKLLPILLNKSTSLMFKTTRVNLKSEKHSNKHKAGESLRIDSTIQQYIISTTEATTTELITETFTIPSTTSTNIRTTQKQSNEYGERITEHNVEKTPGTHEPSKRRSKTTHI